MQLTFSQRWQDRAEYRRPAGETIVPAEYAVDVIHDRVARPFVEQHHYSGSYPAARLAVGLFRSVRLVGAAVFSVPMNEATVPRYTGLEPNAGAMLGRLVLAPEVPANGESWFLARAFRQLRVEKPGVRAVISYADPMELRTPEGRVVKRGHWGTIYQASNAAYLGRSRPRNILVSARGQVISERAISKIRGGEQGREYAAAQLLELGAPARAPGEAAEAWIKRALAAMGAERRRHVGNFVYAFGLDADAHRAVRDRNAPLEPYPKREGMFRLAGRGSLPAAA